MVPSIIATCKQTRFHLLDNNPSQEVSQLAPVFPFSSNPLAQIDVDGLNVSVVATPNTNDTSTDTSSKPSKPKGKSKAKAEARELIVDAHLRLKPGIHYGFLGRNGTGKSSKRSCILIVHYMVYDGFTC